jgi:hypothetical protein
VIRLIKAVKLLTLIRLNEPELWKLICEFARSQRVA